MHSGSVTGGAIFDATGAYRYALWRVWDEVLPRMAFIMLNPSTADAERNDPTIRRCIGFARAWGYGGVHVVNLFAYRTPSPAVLRKAEDPIGLENDDYLREAATGAAFVVAAWGNHGAAGGRDAAVRGLLSSLGVAPRCLGITRAGQPRHPLYARGDLAPFPLPLPPSDGGRAGMGGISLPCA